MAEQARAIQRAETDGLRRVSATGAESEIVMVDGTFFGDSFEQDRSWDDSGTTISGI